MTLKETIKDLHEDELEAIRGYEKAIAAFEKTNPGLVAGLRHILKEEKEHAAFLVGAGKRASRIVKHILGNERNKQ
jgi:rubrerythrin